MYARITFPDFKYLFRASKISELVIINFVS